MPSSEDLDRLSEHHQLTVRYVDPSTPVGAGITDEPLPYPLSPNGSMRNIAGIAARRDLLGLMPHPEAIYARWLHPEHTTCNVRHRRDGRLGRARVADLQKRCGIREPAQLSGHHGHPTTHRFR